MSLIENYSPVWRREEDFIGTKPSLTDRLMATYKALAGRPKLKLIDISRYQRGEIVDIKAIKAAGIVGVIIQATYGLYLDSAFPLFWRMFLDEGFIVMTYHLFWAALSGVDQAHHHLETVMPLWTASGARYPAWNDIELRDGITNAARITRATDWKRAVAKETEPGVYCSESLWNELMDGTPLGDQFGWCAAWNRWEAFNLPRGWTYEQTIMRQNGVARKHDWVEPVPGITGDHDRDDFFGTMVDLKDLNRLGEGTPPPPIPPEPEENMSVLDKLKAARPQLVSALDNLDKAIVELEAETPQPPPPSPPTPPPPTVRTVRMQVKADPHCKVWCFQVWNETKGKVIEKRNDVLPVGQPIMQEYFDDDDKRTTFNKGLILTFLKDLVNADGPIDFMELANAKGAHDVSLFVKRTDLSKLE